MAHPWHDIALPSDDALEIFPVVIEVPQGNKNKYELDKRTGLLRVDRVLYSAVRYPANYGFVPLLPMMANHQKQNMRDHLVAVQDIVLALATDDYAGIERAAKRIGYSDEMGKMCTHMGAGAQGFTEQSIRFHHTADGIADAARSHDRAKVVSQLGVTLQTCTACHALWKQRVVDDATWSQVTAQALPAPRQP